MRKPSPIKATESSDERISIVGSKDFAYIELYSNVLSPVRARRLAAWLLKAADWIERGQYED
jgi:hypothetical protein